jgi:glycosyltransferase involved in cell wall biosynthesis
MTHHALSSSQTSAEPLVSGVIIFLNAARYFEEAIESVFAQTYENWELLLVDDGSSDASSEIAKRYATQHPSKVRYLEHPNHENRGMSASRNLGIRNARGACIALLDADDIWLPHKLKDQVAILNANPEAMMMYGRTRFWWSWSGRPEDTHREWMTPLGLTPNRVIQPPDLLTHFLFHEDAVPSTCSVLMRKELFERVGYFEEEFRGQFEDLIFYAKVCLHCPVYVADGCWDQYRQHRENSVSQAIASGEFHAFKPNPAREKYLRWVAGYTEKQGVSDQRLRKALRHELFPYRHPAISGALLRIKDCYTQQRKWLGKQLRRALPPRLHYAIGRRLRGNAYAAPKSLVDFGSLRRVWPISDDRKESGVQIGRFYIEQFLSRRSSDIAGRVLEFGNAGFAVQLAGNRVGAVEVGDSKALANAGVESSLSQMPGNSLDCIIEPGQLASARDVTAALKQLHRILKPGGVLLALFPGFTQLRNEADATTPVQCFTRQRIAEFFVSVFSKENVRMECFGNVLAATAALHGLSANELTRDELEQPDPRYDVIIGVRAVKPRE